MQRHMLYPKMTLNTMVSVGTMLGSRYLKQSDYMFIKYNDPNMVPTDTIGFRVTMGDNMCLCSRGLSLSDLKVTANVNSIAKGPKATVQRHMLFPKVTLNTMVSVDYSSSCQEHMDRC